MGIRVQRVRNAEGEIIGYRSQPRHPLTGRQVSVTGKTEAEVQLRVLEIQQLRRDRAAGVSPEQITSELGRRAMRPRQLAERWRDFEAVHSARSGFTPRLSAWRTTDRAALRQASTGRVDGGGNGPLASRASEDLQAEEHH